MKNTVLPSLALLTFVLTPPARAEIVNVAGNGVPYTTGQLWAPGKWDIHKLNDGDTQGFFHLDTAPDVGVADGVDLGKDYSITEIRIYPRQDGCCPERLKQIHVSVNKDNGGIIGAEVWGTDLFIDGTNAGSKAGDLVKVILPTAQTGRWVQIKSIENPVPDYALQFGELEVYADVTTNEVNRALQTLATSNQPLYGTQKITSLVNGNRSPGDVIHGIDTLTSPFFYEVNLGTKVKLSRIVVWARQDACCPERLSNYRVSVHADNGGKIGNQVWSAALHTDGSNPGSDPGSKDELLAGLDPSGTFEGQWIHIESLDNPVPPYALQIGEVETFGAYTGPAALLLSGQPQDTVTGIGLTATFNVAAIAPAGDNSKITYQWQKDGTNIAGATSATYTTQALGSTDDKTRFRCVVGYPSLPSQTSAEAVVRLDLAYHASAYSNRPLWAPGGWKIDKLVDGDRNGVFHMDTAPAPGAAYDVDLGATVKFDEIDILPRQDACCPERLTNIRVAIHKDDAGQLGAKVWSADYFTDGTNPGSGPGTIIKVTAADNKTDPFEGQWIHIESLDAQPPDYAMQMTELEVYGAFTTTVPVLAFSQDAQDYATAPGRIAKFSVTAKVLNGDPTKIVYQWQKNDANIPGAISNSFTTGIILDADVGTKYRCLVSYPGARDLTGREALVTFDYNYAKGQPAYTSQPLWAPGGWNISVLTDGDRENVFHLDSAPALDPYYDVDLGAEVKLDRIDIYPRQDGCCPERLTNIRVSVRKDAGGKPGDTVWHTDLFTDGTNPGSGAGIIVTIAKDGDPNDPFQGQWVRVESLDNPVPDYGLQMTELEVIGKLVSPIVAPLTLDFLRTSTGLKLSWTAGALESAADVNGLYTPVAGAVSPYDVVANKARGFYRLRQ